MKFWQRRGETLRFGLDFYNPCLPLIERETNKDWLLREIADLKLSIEHLEKEMI